MGGCVRIRVDEDLCSASTTCVMLAPALFEMPSGAITAVVKVAEVDDPELVALAREAEDSCPTEAIVVEPAD